MVRYRRNRVAGRTYFFTVTLADRRSGLLVQRIEALRDAFRRAKRERPFAIDAIVVLPDHVHAIFTLPEGDADYSGRWRLIKSAFSRSVAGAVPRLARRQRRLPLWQTRFWEHTIRDDGDFARHVDYTHWNPEKHRLVTAVRAWPHSSFHRFVRRGILPGDWGGEIKVRGRFGD